MKSINCLVLLGLLVASASAAPGIIGTIFDTIHSSVAESSAQSKAHSLGGSIGVGPFSIGGNLNSASSKSQSSAAAINSAGYVPSHMPEPTYGGISGSHAESSAQSEAHSLGGGIGGSLNSASSKSHASAAAINSAGYVPTYGGVSGSHAESSAQSEARSLGGGFGFGPFTVGANLNSAHSTAHSSASAVNANYDRVPSLYQPGYVPEFGSVAQAHAQAEAQAVAESQGGYRRYY